jgi:hypothetical protein
MPIAASGCPFSGDRPPLTPEDVEAAMANASARHAFWRDLRTPRPIDEAIAGASPGQIIAYCVPYSHAVPWGGSPAELHPVAGIACPRGIAWDGENVYVVAMQNGNGTIHELPLGGGPNRILATEFRTALVELAAAA